MHKITDIDVAATNKAYVTPTPKEIIVRVYAAENFGLTINGTDALTGASSLIASIASTGNEIVMRITNLDGCDFVLELTVYGNNANSHQAIKAHFVSNTGDFELIPNTDCTIEVYG